MPRSKLRSRTLRVVIWCARKHRHHAWSPLAMTLLLCCVIGSVLSHIDGMLMVGEFVLALIDLGLQGYNAHHRLKRQHRPVMRTHPDLWFHLRRQHLRHELRFKAPLALGILVVILVVLCVLRR